MADPPVRLLNFVSENELEEGREKGVVPRDDLQSFPDRPLFEILKENKDKKDAEFNELLKHRLSPSSPFFPPHFFLLA
jgi:hypothetical protein